MLCLVSVVVALQLSGCDQTPAEAMAGAKARIAKKDDAAAEIDLKNILQDNPDSAEARYLLGVQIQKRGDHASALIELLRARTLKHPEHVVVPSIVQSLLAQGKAEELRQEATPRRLLAARRRGDDDLPSFVQHAQNAPRAPAQEEAAHALD